MQKPAVAAIAATGCYCACPTSTGYRRQPVVPASTREASAWCARQSAASSRPTDAFRLRRSSGVRAWIGIRSNGNEDDEGNPHGNKEGSP
jgi:hypothetical protein